MGYLSPISDLVFPQKQEQKLDETALLNLFKYQQRYLNFFFQNSDLSQTLKFTQTVVNSNGTIFFTGVGKSGFVARKISQTKSGNSEELIRLAPCAKAKGAYLAGVTSCEMNNLMQFCGLNVHLPLERELCPFGLAPVTSTAIQMVFGDTVAIALMGARNLTKEEYAANHPAGKIGKSLIFKVMF
ncbi:hypothetical protein Cgig2_030849 [Carnegiea gigantea]|uniref:SIS domain-containing protein n=1 Tax=Carnegiea gigantea TaxID=171969 RepID=A0A9Q1GM01_9CARY|nr:hypothetical protein Cgig2_030849 [Carnegiea gigantea]